MPTTREFREDALKLADTVGIPAAAKELGVTTVKLYGWRSSAKKKSSVSQRETELTTENARLKRQWEEKTEELNILKRRQPTSRKQKH
ncbi:transposase [Endozoicomonas sp.]|nr:transposase [Endozoicomonas sp.]